MFVPAALLPPRSRSYYGQQGPVQSNPYQYGYPPHQYPPSANQYQGQGGGGQRFPNMPRG